MPQMNIHEAGHLNKRSERIFEEAEHKLIKLWAHLIFVKKGPENW